MLGRKEKIKQKRRFSVPKTSYEERKTGGARKNFSRYLRVSPECFQRLFNVGVPFITKQELQKLYTSKKTPYPYPSALPFCYVADICSQQALRLIFELENLSC